KGRVTFNLYDTPTGTGRGLFTDANERLVGGRAMSRPFTPTALGTVYWVATFNDPSNTNPTASSGPAAEPVTVVAAPTITTTQQPTTATVGTPIADTATVTGGNNPTGTVTFNLYNNSTASGTPLFTDTETLVTGTATSASFTTTAVAPVYWGAPSTPPTTNPTETRARPAEPVTVPPASPGITTTQQPASVTVGGSIADMATVSGGFNPTGTVTF